MFPASSLCHVCASQFLSQCLFLASRAVCIVFSFVSSVSLVRFCSPVFAGVCHLPDYLIVFKPSLSYCSFSHGLFCLKLSFHLHCRFAAAAQNNTVFFSVYLFHLKVCNSDPLPA